MYHQLVNYRENTHPAAYSSTHQDMLILRNTKHDTGTYRKTHTQQHILAHIRTGSFLGIPSIPVHTRTGDFQVTVCQEYFSVCFSDNEINTVLITSEFLL